MIIQIPHIMAAALLRLLGPTVDEANAAAAAELDDRAECAVPLLEQPYDCPERVRWALTAISDRECIGNFCAYRRWIGRHRRDSVHERNLWRAGHRRGSKGYRKSSLHWWCPAHATPEGMSTVGPHGLIYLFNVHRLEVAGNCIPWWIFAAPANSARAARHRYLQRCKPGRQSKWCPSAAFVAQVKRRRCKRKMLTREECSEKPPVKQGGAT